MIVDREGNMRVVGREMEAGQRVMLGELGECGGGGGAVMGDLL